MKKLSSIPVEETLSYNRDISFSEEPKGFTVGFVGPAPIPASEVKGLEKAALEEGKREASEAARREFASLKAEYVQRHEEVLAAMQKQSASMASELIERLPEITLALARRVLGGIELDRDAVVGIITNLIGEFATQDEKLEVYLCPDDLKLLKMGEKLAKEEPEESQETDDFSGALAGLFDSLGGDEALLEGYPNVSFHEDTDLNRGDCQIKSRFGLLDGRIHTKLKKVAEEIAQ